MSMIFENPFKNLPEINTSKEKLVPKGPNIYIRMPTKKSSVSSILVMPEEVEKKEQVKHCRGILHSVGPSAFQGVFEGYKTEIGETVMIERYHGLDFFDVATGDIFKLTTDDKILSTVETMESSDE